MTPDAPLTPGDVTEDEMHAFIDGQLPPARTEAVRDHLAANPDEARRVDAYVAQRAALRAALADPPGPALPPKLLLSRIGAEAVRRQRRFVPWQMAAAVLLAVGLGGAGGWYIGRPPTPSRDAHAAEVLVKQAVASYAVYGPDQAHPVEFTAAEMPGLIPYLSQRLARPVEVPSLDAVGFDLIGGRIVPTEYGSPALLLVYQNQAGDRIGLLLRPMAPDLRWPVRAVAAQGVAGDCWIGGGMGYAVIGPEAAGDLRRVMKQLLKADTTQG
jgi:anti-sigma factor RsiW